VPGLAASLLSSVLGVAIVGAPKSFEQCDELRLADPAGSNGYTCYYVFARMTDAYDEAIERIEAIASAEPRRPWPRFILGDLLMDTGDDRAPELFRQVAHEFEMLGELDSATYARLSYAFSIPEGSYQAIAAEIGHARSLAKELGDPTLLAQVDVQLARLLVRNGVELGRAQTLLDSVAAALDEPPYELRKHALFVQAELDGALDRPRRASERLAELIELAHEHEDIYIEALARSQWLELVHEDALGLHQLTPQALGDELDKALEVAERSGNPYAKVRLLCIGADLELDVAKAAAGYQRCADQARELEASAARNSASIGMALLLPPSRIDEALALLDEAAERDRHQGAQGHFPRFLRSRTLARAGRVDAALEQAGALLQDLEGQLRRTGDRELRARSVAAFRAYHDEASSWIVPEPGAASPQDLQRALAWIERHRAVVLLDSLGEGGAPLPSSMQPFRDRAADLRRRLRASAPDPTQRAAYIDELDAIERRLTEAEAHRTVAAETHPSLTLETIQARLGPRRALLSFHLMRPPPQARWEQIDLTDWVAVVTADSVKSYVLPPRMQLESAVALFSGLIGPGGDALATGERLYDDLLAEALSALPPEVESLVVVPDGELYRLPFAALPAAGRPLMERFELTIAPSIAVWLELSERTTDPDDPALIVVDPATEDDVVPPAWGVAREELGALPRAREEAAAVRAVHGSTIVRAGAEANESMVKSLFEDRFALIHFGAHALVDTGRIDRAAIVLGGTTDNEDGLLRPAELSGAELSGAVVVLAACRSANGPIVGAEGPMSLARALLEGGARTVVASLWKVRDDESAAFFGAFYRHLGTGMTVAAAVQAAARDLERAGAPPAAWAGFVVIGDGDARPFVPQPPIGWLLSVGAGLLLLLLLLLMGIRDRSRRRRP